MLELLKGALYVDTVEGIDTVKTVVENAKISIGDIGLIAVVIAAIIGGVMFAFNGEKGKGMIIRSIIAVIVIVLVAGGILLSIANDLLG